MQCTKKAPVKLAYLITCSSWHQESFTFQCSAECQGIARCILSEMCCIHRFLSIHVDPVQIDIKKGAVYGSRALQPSHIHTEPNLPTQSFGGLQQMMTRKAWTAWNIPPADFLPEFPSFSSSEEMATAVSSSSSSFDFGAIPRYLSQPSSGGANARICSKTSSADLQSQTSQRQRCKPHVSITFEDMF